MFIHLSFFCFHAISWLNEKRPNWISLIGWNYNQCALWYFFISNFLVKHLFVFVLSFFLFFWFSFCNTLLANPKSASLNHRFMHWCPSCLLCYLRVLSILIPSEKCKLSLLNQIVYEILKFLSISIMQSCLFTFLASFVLRRV